MNVRKLDLEHVSTDRIRNFSIISHVDHGKTTLSDHLIAIGGMLPSKFAGSVRALDFLPEEQKRGITIDPSLATFTITYEGEKYLANLIDTPGHVDFSGKVSESLRLVDNGLILIDAVEGVMAQTKTVLRQAVLEGLKLVVFINKIDRLVTELQLPIDRLKQRMQTLIGEIASICLMHDYPAEDIPSFGKGTVILGSGTDGWGIDNQFVQTGGTFNDILSYYQNSSDTSLPPVSNVIARIIAREFIDPLEGQQVKFAKLSSLSSEDVAQAMEQSQTKLATIIAIGQRLPVDESGRIGGIARVMTGNLEVNDELHSSILDEIRTVQKLFYFRGKRQIQTQSLQSGHIGGIIFDKSVIPGDILVSDPRSKIVLKQIVYVQQPVVSVSIEPLNYNEIENLDKTLSLYAETAPGLEYELNQDTGQMIVSGVGTLQLEILQKDIQAMGYEIVISDPIVLEFAIPITTATLTSMLNGVIEVKCGPTSASQNNDGTILYKDRHDNMLKTQVQISEEYSKGLVEVFSRSMRVLPGLNKRMRDFFITIIGIDIQEEHDSYEAGLVLGLYLIKQAMKSCEISIHEPYYEMQINVPQAYLGITLTQLERAKATIHEVRSQQENAHILADIKVTEGIKLADILRQVSDGNAFWAFPRVIFKEVKR